MISNTDLGILCQWLSNTIVPVEAPAAPEQTEIDKMKQDLENWNFDYESEFEEWIKTQWLEKSLELTNLPEDTPDEIKQQLVDTGIDNLKNMLDFLTSEMNFEKLELDEDIFEHSLRICMEIIPDDPPTRDQTWNDWLQEKGFEDWWQSEEA